ncbi:MAG: tetratricopeptide repeat-containing sulfotransferase family protein [Planctomycetota bacterium]
MAALSSSAAFSRAVELLNAGDVVRAEQVCRDILARNRKDHRVLAVLGQIATMTSRHDEAVNLLGQCVAVAPREIGYHILLAEALATQGRHDEALSRYDKALRLESDSPPALAGKASVLSRLDRWDEARTLLEPHVEGGAEDAGMAVAYARIAVHDRDFARAVEVASRHLDDDTGDEIRRSLWFDIGKAHERAGDHDRAFEAYTSGKRMRVLPWDPAAAAARHDQLMAVFTAETVKGLPRPPEPSALPVFIAGMPRCGSTLIEQIIDAHPQAFGAGEIQDLPQLLLALNMRIGSTLPYPECVRDLDQEDVDDLARDYLQRLGRYAPQAARVCNKDLGNYQHLGLIAAVFPEARIIHARRDPLDTCLSCYVQKFAPGSHDYSADLRHLGLAYNDYLALMDHWRRTGIPMLEVDYEELVENQEAISRQIIEYCGLPWDDLCLRFHESGRRVITLSHEQVKRPMYASSIGRHRHYEKYLGPLREVLEQGLRGI